MQLRDLIKDSRIVKPQEILNREISGIFYDSRRVIPESVFVAISGSSFDGNAFVQDAIEKGARVIVSEKKDLILPQGVGLVVVENSRRALAEMAENFFDKPTRKMKIIGITGTKGKTSTSVIIKKIFEEAGFKSGLIGTIQYEIGERILPSTNTTPESVDLQFLFSQMYQNGITHSVIEVSSHAIDQRRINLIHFDAGVLTNIASHEHLYYHKNFRSYVEAKLKFFSTYLKASEKNNKYAIINLDDRLSGTFIKTAIGSGLNVVTYGLSKKAMFHPDSFSFDRNGTVFTLKGKKFFTKLPGTSSLYNCLSAIATASSFGIDIDIICQAISKIEVIPGRMEFVDTGRPFTVVVDYAHTHKALEELLKTVRHLKPARILLVFGCGGNRDRSKRPLMGKVAAALADRVYITSDNPRNEDPEKIIEEIYSGIVFWRRKKCEIIPDRKAAIAKALSDARENDWIVIAGKGHEQYQIIKNVFYPFDDRKVVQELMQSKGN